MQALLLYARSKCDAETTTDALKYTSSNALCEITKEEEKKEKCKSIGSTFQQRKRSSVYAILSFDNIRHTHMWPYV